jgi:hypothetical protein
MKHKKQKMVKSLAQKTTKSADRPQIGAVGGRGKQRIKQQARKPVE